MNVPAKHRKQHVWEKWQDGFSLVEIVLSEDIFLVDKHVAEQRETALKVNTQNYFPQFNFKRNNEWYTSFFFFQDLTYLFKRLKLLWNFPSGML